MSLKKKSGYLLVVAHPDDEAIFFAGLIMSKKKHWHVICVTDGNADKQGKFRLRQFQKSCKKLGASSVECWNFPDVFRRRLNIEKLQNLLSDLPNYKMVFTHGIMGEYGHPHHQDVSYAVHKAFHGRTPVYSPAYNCYPELSVKLTPRQFKIKTDLLWNVYSSEIRRFLNFIPATSFEGFTCVDLKEVESLYAWLRYKKPLKTSALKNYRWLKSYLQQGGGNLVARPF